MQRPYGLIKPGAPAPGVCAAPPPRSAAFGVDEDESPGGLQASLAREQAVAAARAAREMEAAKASGQLDASVFDYDSWKSGAEEAAAAAKAAAASSARKAEVGAKYIGTLLATAQERSKERDALRDKKIARRLEEEEALYGKTESFVTSGYEATLEARKAAAAADAATGAAEEAALHSGGDSGLASIGLYRSLVSGISSSAPTATTASTQAALPEPVVPGPSGAAAPAPAPASPAVGPGSDSAPPAKRRRLEALLHDPPAAPEAAPAPVAPTPAPVATPAPDTAAAAREARAAKIAAARERALARWAVTKGAAPVAPA